MASLTLSTSAPPTDMRLLRILEPVYIYIAKTSEINSERSYRNYITSAINTLLPSEHMPDITVSSFSREKVLKEHQPWINLFPSINGIKTQHLTGTCPSQT